MKTLYCEELTLSATASLMTLDFLEPCKENTDKHWAECERILRIWCTNNDKLISYKLQKKLIGNALSARHKIA